MQRLTTHATNQDPAPAAGVSFGRMLILSQRRFARFAGSTQPHAELMATHAFASTTPSDTARLSGLRANPVAA